MAKFVRVKDPDTKHEFDVPETDPRLKKGVLTRIKSDRYPPVDRPRAAKFHIPRKQAAAAVETEKEPENG